MQIENIELRSIKEWDAFVEANRDAIIERCGSVVTAMQYAMDGGLELGGGAAPLFIITFEM